MRIVSLLPSATEILFALGLGDQVVGVTFECDYPPEARARRIVSDTSLPSGLSPAEIDAIVRERVAAGDDLYCLDEDALRELAPDVVVTQNLCAVCAVDLTVVEDALCHLGAPAARVLTLDPMTLEAVFASIEEVARTTGTMTRARRLVDDLRARLARVARVVGSRPRPRVAMLEWTDPPFSSGHWVPDMVVAAGGVPVLGIAGARSERITWADVVAAAPDVVVVAPCGYRLDGAADLGRSVVEAGVLPSDAAVWAVDADAAFVRPGPRLVDGVEALAHVLHPDAVPPVDGMAVCVRAATGV